MDSYIRNSFCNCYNSTFNNIHSIKGQLLQTVLFNCLIGNKNDFNLEKGMRVIMKKEEKIGIYRKTYTNGGLFIRRKKTVKKPLTQL